MKKRYRLWLQDEAYKYDQTGKGSEESWASPFSSYKEAAENAQDWVNEATERYVDELEDCLSEVEGSCDDFDDFAYTIENSDAHCDLNSNFYTCIWACDEDGDKIDCKLKKDEFYNDDPLIEEKKDILQNEAEEFLDIINESPEDDDAIRRIRNIIIKTHIKLDIINEKIKARVDGKEVKNEYFVNGTTPEKVVEEGLKLAREYLDDMNHDSALYLYPDGDMRVLVSATGSNEWPDPECRALCIASYSPNDGTYMDAAFEDIEASMEIDISKEEYQEILDYAENNGVGIEAYKVCQPELFKMYDDEAREEALDVEREKLEEIVSDLAKTLNYTPNKKSLSDVKKTVTEKRETMDEAGTKARNHGR